MSTFIATPLEIYGMTSDNKKLIRYHFECDTYADIPTLSDYAALNEVIALGSDAHVIDPNSTYEMQSDGTWVIQDVGNDYYSKAETDALAAYEGIRLLRQGEEIPEGADLNSYDTAGVYYSPNGTRTGTLYNRPWSGSGFKLLTWSISSTSKQQWVMPMSQTAHSLFFRNRISSGWRPWYELEGVEITTINPRTAQQLTSLNPGLLSTLGNVTFDEEEE